MRWNNGSLEALLASFGRLLEALGTLLLGSLKHGDNRIDTACAGTMVLLSSSCPGGRPFNVKVASPHRSKFDLPKRAPQYGPRPPPRALKTSREAWPCSSSARVSREHIFRLRMATFDRATVQYYSTTTLQYYNRADKSAAPAVRPLQ